MATRGLQLLIFIVAGLMSGCTFTTHDVALDAIAPIKQSGIGTGTTLYFRLTDERDAKTVGHRGVGTIGAKISAPDIEAFLGDELRRGFSEKGYALVEEQADAESIVTFRLRAFKFELEMGFWTGGKNVSVVLAADALRSGKTYSNVYRDSSESRTLFVPFGSAIDDQMNDALSSVVTQALTDGNLDLFLTGK